MKIEIDELTGPHWKFSLALYRKPGVAESCLTLQDMAGIDVNVLLIALYTVARGSGLPEWGWLHAADDSISDLRAMAIVPLRQARRAIKKLAQPSALTEAIRARVKGLELEAEQLEQAMLARLMPEKGNQPPDFAAAAERIVSLYARPDGARDINAEGDVARSIHTIADAASKCKV